MRFLIWSDHQFNDWREFSEVLPNGLNSRFADQLNVLDEISTRDSDVMIHTGDLFETLSEKINKSVFLVVYDKIARMARKTVVILMIGNHDWLDRTEKSHLLEPFKEIDNVIVIDKPSFQQFGNNLGAVFMPYTRYNFSTKLDDMVSKYASGFSNNNRKFLFTHQGVSGAKVGPRDIILREEFSLEAFLPEYFDFVFLGHYHKHQRMLSNFVIVGSPIQRDFGERNDKKGYLIFDTETLDLVHCETQAPRFFKIEANQRGEINIPLDYRKDTDFLWVIGQKDLNDAELIQEHKHIRIEKKDFVDTITRTDIGITMPKKQQLEKFIAFSKPSLDREKLLGVGLSISEKRNRRKKMGALKKIWFWTKKLLWLFLIAVGLIVAAVASGRKNKKIVDIDKKIAEAKAIENKTVEDLRKIEKLQGERKEAEKEIIDIAEKFKNKADKLKDKPKQPGDAGKSSDELTKIW